MKLEWLDEYAATKPRPVFVRISRQRVRDVDDGLVKCHGFLSSQLHFGRGLIKGMKSHEQPSRPC